MSTRQRVATAIRNGDTDTLTDLMLDPNRTPQEIQFLGSQIYRLDRLEKTRRDQTVIEKAMGANKRAMNPGQLKDLRDDIDMSFYDTKGRIENLKGSERHKMLMERFMEFQNSAKGSDRISWMKQNGRKYEQLLRDIKSAEANISAERVAQRAKERDALAAKKYKETQTRLAERAKIDNAGALAKSYAASVKSAESAIAAFSRLAKNPNTPEAEYKAAEAAAMEAERILPGLRAKAEQANKAYRELIGGGTTDPTINPSTGKKWTQEELNALPQEERDRLMEEYRKGK